MERHRELAKRLYAAINDGDIATLLDGVADDVEFKSLVAEAEGDTFRGHDGVRRWWSEVLQALGGLDFELEEYAEDGDGIVTRLRVRGSVETLPLEQTMWQGVVIRDGKAAWWAAFREEDEAWAAVRERVGANRAR